MSDLKSIIDSIKRLETTLVEQFQADGRGLHEKLSSVEHKIPQNLQRSIRYLATLRNKAIHEDGYEIEKPEDFLRQAGQAHEQLLAVAQQRTLRPAVVMNVGQPGQFKPTVLAIGVLIIAGGWFAANKMESRPSRQAEAPAAEEVEPVQPATHQPAAAAVTPRESSVQELESQAAKRNVASLKSKAAGTVNEAAEPAEQAEVTAKPSLTSTRGADASAAASALKQAVAERRSAGIGNGALRVDGVQFKPGPGSFLRQEPKITLSVTNTSDKTLSSGRADLMLFINGQDIPVVSSQNHYVHMGERGLSPGESRNVDVSMGMGDFAWTAPDILNAKQHVLVARIAGTDDGSRKAIGGAAPAFPWSMEAPKRSSQASAGPVQDVDMRSAVESGQSVGAGNSAVILGVPSIRFGAGAWGKDAEITVEIENVSDQTISSVRADALLFIDGHLKPVVGDTDAVRFYFGERGLAPGKRFKASSTLDGLKSYGWNVPDVLNAKTRLLALRVSGTDDGMRKEFGGAARPFPWKMPAR